MQFGVVLLADVAVLLADRSRPSPARAPASSASPGGTSAGSNAGGANTLGVVKTGWRRSARMPVACNTRSSLVTRAALRCLPIALTRWRRATVSGLKILPGGLDQARALLGGQFSQQAGIAGDLFEQHHEPVQPLAQVAAHARHRGGMCVGGDISHEEVILRARPGFVNELPGVAGDQSPSRRGMQSVDAAAYVIKMEHGLSRVPCPRSAPLRAPALSPRALGVVRPRRGGVPRGARAGPVRLLDAPHEGADPALRDALARDRGRYVVATGPLLGFFPGALRKAVENARRTLGTDVIDVFQLFWLGKMSAFTRGVQAEMTALRDEGKVRWLCVSIHDRPRAGRLAADSILDALMIRYNAAHPGAEQEIFRTSPRGARRSSPTRRPRGASSWPRRRAGPAGSRPRATATASSSPRRTSTSRSPARAPSGSCGKTSPRVERGPLSAEEDAWMRAIGRAVHG